MCRQELSASLISQCMELELPKKKRYFGAERGANKHPFDINDTVIKCQHCKEHFEYDTLISYFTSKHKYNKDYEPECPHCHGIWFNNKFLYDTFGRDFCKGVLNLFDPYACKVCQERKELVHCKVCADCLKQHFQTNENAFFDCSECHEKFTVNFIFDHFDLNYCKNVLHLEDPYACKGCLTRFYPTYTCKYCNTKICKVCEKQHLEQAIKNNERLNCMYCHHFYTSSDLYSDIFYNDKIYVNAVLQVEYPFECKLCRKDIKNAINNPDRYRRWDQYEFITCENCERHFCKDCLFSYLRKLAEEYKKNTAKFDYIPEGFYTCPCCNQSISSKFLFKKFYDNAHDKLYLIDPSKICVRCNKLKYKSFLCYNCHKTSCLECLCEQHIIYMLNHPEIEYYSELPCIYCGKYIVSSTEIYKYLDEQTCKKLLLESEYDKLYRENVKKCPNCGEPVYKAGGCDHMYCVHCHTMFDWYSLKITRTTTNPLYYAWLKEQGIYSNEGRSYDTLKDNSVNSITNICSEEHYEEEQFNEHETYECEICYEEYTSKQTIKCPKCKQYLCLNCVEAGYKYKHNYGCIYCKYDLSDIYNKKKERI